MPLAPRTVRTVALAVAAALLATGVAVAIAEPGPSEITEPATVGVRAQRMVVSAQPGDVISVFNVGELQADLAAAVAESARSAGASWAPTRSATVGIVAVRRGADLVQQPPAGYRYPLVVTAMPRTAVAGIMGGDVAAALGPSSVVMGALTAQRRSATVGDVVDVVADDGSIRSLTVSMVATDSQVGGAEVVMADDTAGSLGITRATRAVVWGFPARSTIESALAANGVTTKRETRVVRGWDPPSPDSTLGSARTKSLLGEFAYLVLSSGADGAIAQDPIWTSASLPAGREVLNAQIPIRARCHVRVALDLRSALAEVAAAGLGGAIDVANANTYGGCHNPRFNRISAEFGSLSRHAWAMALDFNTVSNCQGCVPRMDCRVVHIFRKHGFAWGGNFLRPDGMHFEWVGERRDQLAYPSGYCPNPVSAASSGIPNREARGQLFADETLAAEHDHAHDS